jgi:hypothetical protein
MKGTAIYSWEDVVRYGSRVTITLEGGCGLKSSPHYRIEQGKLYHVWVFGHGKGSCQKVDTQATDIKHIFRKIKNVYDSNGILIARRVASGQPLRSTNKGQCKRLKRPEMA